MIEAICDAEGVDFDWLSEEIKYLSVYKSYPEIYSEELLALAKDRIAFFHDRTRAGEKIFLRLENFL